MNSWVFPHIVGSCRDEWKERVLSVRRLITGWINQSYLSHEREWMDLTANWVGWLCKQWVRLFHCAMWNALQWWRELMNDSWIPSTSLALLCDWLTTRPHQWVADDNPMNNFRRLSFCFWLGLLVLRQLLLLFSLTKNMRRVEEEEDNDFHMHIISAVRPVVLCQPYFEFSVYNRFGLSGAINRCRLKWNGAQRIFQICLSLFVLIM